jgi:hypothetical protein
VLCSWVDRGILTGIFWCICSLCEGFIVGYNLHDGELVMLMIQRMLGYEDTLAGDQLCWAKEQDIV